MIGRDAPAGRLNFVWAMAFVGLLSACSGGIDKTTSNNTNVAFLVSGSVGDGPIVDARITVTDASGTVVLSTTADSTANYRIDVPSDALMPLTIRASGGIDLVTGRAADFELMAVVMASGEQTINVSPLTTLAVQTATCSTGGLNAASLQNSWNTIHREVAMGLDSALVSDPMGEAVTGANVEMVVLANEALGEVVRRTQIALTAAGTTISTDEVIRQLGCDLADGDLDGVGSSVNARVISTFRAVEAAVLLEVIAGRLEVDGQDATVLMDQAIRTVMPSFSPDVAGVSVTNDIVDQAQDALAILQGVYPDAELFAFATLLSEIDPAIAKSDVDAVLSSASLVALHGLAARVANASTTEIDLLANRMRVQEQADAPVVSFGTDEVSVAEGGTTMLSWATVNADQCVAAKGWSGAVALTGTYQTDPLTTTTEFSLICAGIGGTTIESVTVEVTGILPPNPDPAPTVGISATEVAVFSGQSTTLNWSSENANSCSASGGWSGSRGTSGSETVGPLTVDTTFTLSCTGSGGTSTNSATVTVTPAPAPTLSFSATDAVVDSGDTPTLNWSSQNANSCTASGGWSGSKGTNGSEAVGPLSANTTFSITCTGTGGNAVSMLTISVNGVLQLSWVAPTENVDGSPLTDLAGYKIYYGTQAQNYPDWTDVSDASATQFELTLPMGTYYVTMTALDADGNESVYSNEVIKIPI